MEEWYLIPLQSWWTITDLSTKTQWPIQPQNRFLVIFYKRNVGMLGTALMHVFLYGLNYVAFFSSRFSFMCAETK